MIIKREFYFSIPSCFDFIYMGFYSYSFKRDIFYFDIIGYQNMFETYEIINTMYIEDV